MFNINIIFKKNIQIKLYFQINVSFQETMRIAVISQELLTWANYYCYKLYSC